MIISNTGYLIRYFAVYIGVYFGFLLTLNAQSQEPVSYNSGRMEYPPVRDVGYNFTMNGNASQLSESCFQITPDASGQSGSVWFNYKTNLSQDFNIVFDAYFGNKPTTSPEGADGMVFVLQNDCYSSGGSGSDLGYGGVSPSIGIEFDTYDNGVWSDLSADHTAIHQNGSVNHATNLAGPVQTSSSSTDIEDNTWHTVEVTWNATTNTLSVYFDGVFRLSYTGDIVNNVFGGDPMVFWGFTAGTGLYYNAHQVCITTYPDESNPLTDETICLGDSVYVEAPGGANSYSWTPTTGVSDPNSNATFLSPTVTTEYVLEIEDACADFAYDTILITVNSPPADAGISTDICPGETTTITATGGVSYNWDNGLGAGASHDVTPGTTTVYTVTVTNAQGCTATDDVTITVNSLPTVSFSGLASECCVDALTDTLTGNNAPDGTFSGDGITDNGDGTAIFDPATAGEGGPYEIIYIYTDGNGCANSDTQTVAINPKPAIQIADSANVQCYSGNDGEIILSVVGGTPAYSYEWDVATTVDSIANNLVTGDYSVTVTDSNGCTETRTITISQPDTSVYLMTSSINSNCGQDDGSAQVIAAGGTSPYSYLWDNGDTLNITDSLYAGSYQVTVTDANGCTESEIISVSDMDAGILSFTGVTNNPCYGDSLGEITLEVTGGTEPFSYTWSNGETESTADSLVAGIYSIAIIDDNGCVITGDTVVTEPTLLISDITDSSNITCYGYADGMSVITPSGGSPWYFYLWDDISATTDSTITGLYADIWYHVIVTDINGCITLDSTMVSQPDSLISSISQSADVLCYGDTTGSAVVTPYGGLPQDGYIYTYLWDDVPATTDSTITGLQADVWYHVLITDINGCSTLDSVIPDQPDSALALSGGSVDASCTGANGYAYVIATGGTSGYNYEWNTIPPQYTDTASNLTAGFYTVTVTDQNGCVGNDTIDILVSGIIIPSAFTPNGDGTNDTWMIRKLEAFHQVTVEIYNRWSQQLYSFSGTGYDYNYDEAWDGTCNDKPVPLGSYVYILNIHNGNEPYNGIVTVIR